MAKLSFLGLGLMGTPLATRLINAGHEVTVWNRSVQRTQPLADAGAHVAPTPAAAAEGVEFVLTMLANPEAFEEVLFGPDGLASALSPGQTLIDMSTIGPSEIRSAALRLPSGVAIVDAPVRGSVPEATAGQLHIYIGANDVEFMRVRPILEVLGDVHHVGTVGAGASAKLVVNTTLTTAIVAFGEALALGRKLGLDQQVLLDVLESSPIGSVVRAKRVNVESGKFPPNFKLSLAAKDMRLAMDAASGINPALKAAPSVSRWFEEAIDQGAGELDFSAIVATILGQPAQS